MEESFQAGKSQVGLDQHQLRQWQCWQRFTVLAIAALAVLTACAAARPIQPIDPYHHARADGKPIPLSVNEIRRLFNTFIIATARGVIRRLTWTIWRGEHQTRARRAHYQRRLRTELGT